MWQQRKRLEALDVQVKIVTFDSNFMARAYIKNSQMTWPLLIDPEQKLYEAYELTRGGWSNIYGPTSIWNYLKLIFRGRLPGKPGRDWRQLGGDILIDPSGIVRLQHISTGPHDRPSVESILKAVEVAG